MNRAELISQFYGIFGTEGGEARVFCAPGRINLIGDQTDRNGGHVFSCALDLKIYAAVRKSRERRIRMQSRSMNDGVREISLDEELTYRASDGWLNYVKGVLWALSWHGHVIQDGGLDIFFESTLPAGAGLASSAALEVLMAAILREMYGFECHDDVDLALAGYSAETEFIGQSCGFLDQFTCAMGKKDHALFINVGKERCEYVPLKLGDTRIVITDSGVRNPVRQSVFKERAEETGKILRKLQYLVNIRQVCDLSLDRFESVKDVLMNDVLVRRARYLISEDMRTIQAVSAMRVGNLNRFGEIMKRSHISLRDDYEIVCPELDFLAVRAWQEEGVIGSRMTGGGYDGCTVSLVKEANIDSFCENLGRAYREKFGELPVFYVPQTADGVRELL